MKKPFYVLTLLVLIASGVSLQGQTYSFSVFQQPYNSVGVGFPLTKGVFDNPAYVVPIGFDFQFFDDSISTLASHAEYTQGGVLANGFENSTASMIGVFGTDIIDRGFLAGSSMSAIFFSHTGEPGQRVFIQEWLNVGFKNGDLVKNVYTDFINFQLRLYEETGDIVFHFGTSSISNPSADYFGQTGPNLGLLKNTPIAGGGKTEETLILTGNPSNPTVLYELLPVFLNGSIPENTVYLFSRGGTSVNDPKDSKEISYFYPNPSSGELSIKNEGMDEIIFPVTVYNASGSFVQHLDDPYQMSVAGLPAGIYSIHGQTATGWHQERIVVLPD